MSRLPALLLFEQLDLFPLPAAPPAEVAVPPPAGLQRHRPAGDVYNLEQFFTVINQLAFKGVLAPCTLRWSRKRWKITLGLCDVKRRTITINRSLDDARVPDVVIAAVLHHEMLHLYYGISEGPQGYRRFHTPTFRTAERRFPGFAESEKWIAENWPLRGRPAKRLRPQESSFLAYLKLMCA